MARTRTKRSVKARLAEITKMIADVPPPKVRHFLTHDARLSGPRAGEVFKANCGATETARGEVVYLPAPPGPGEIWCNRCIAVQRREI